MNEFSVFFFDSLVSVSKPTEQNSWAFSVYYSKDIEEVSIYSCDPTYTEPELALRVGKRLALENFVLRSQEMLCLTFYPSDRVLMQSNEAIKRFGRAKDMEAASFYPSRQDRIEIIQEIQRAKIAERKFCIFSDIDANRFEGQLICELVEIDDYTKFLLERFKPADVRDLINP